MEIDRTGETITKSGLSVKTHSGFCETSSGIGYNRGIVVCPYCKESNYVSLWSLAGSGKRCEGCYAHLGRMMAFAPTAKDLKRLRRTDARLALWPQLEPIK